jgi:cytochrome c oxidase subunit II
MSGRRNTGRIQRHRSEADSSPPGWLRYLMAGGIVVVVLGAGVVIGFGDFFGRPTAQGNVITMRISMAGYDPNVLVAKPGETLTVDWWNTDNAMHLDGGGVHTLISPELGINERLPAESRKTIQITAPTAPGDYDFYCDSCCGGKESPTMHGTLSVRAA